MSAPATRHLADAFSRLIRRDIPATTLCEVLRLNATADYTYCCATHNYIDANMQMLEAFIAVIGHDPAPDSEADTALMNSAWAIARSSGFQTR
jgi:hypothetical protein